MKSKPKKQKSNTEIWNTAQKSKQQQIYVGINL